MRLRIFVLLVFSAIASAQNLRVTAGAVDDQVFQRDANGSASIRLSGTADAADGKAVEARLSRKAIALTGWDQVATISGGHWSGEVRNVPTGGPYRVEFRIPGANAATAVKDLLVGDLWVLAGQSNMEGVGDLVDTEMPNELVHNFDMADNWMVAEDPLHSLPGAADRVHWRRNANREPERLEGQDLRDFIRARKKGAGLGLPFAVEMVRRTSVPIGLLSCAHGGTSMDQWDPALKYKEGDSLYGSMVRRFRAAGGRVTGLLWYQGESDANPKAAPEFQQKFERFVARVREDFGHPGLPFYYVQIGRHVNDQNQAEWNFVQEAQRLAEATIPKSGMISAIHVSLDDGIHVSTQDHKRLGKAMANLACHDLFPNIAQCRDLKRGPRPASSTFGDGIVRVAFSGVNGRLRAEGRISGFSIHSSDGKPLPVIFKARVDPVDPSAVLLSIGGKLPEGATLRYGFGKDPYCNLTDEADLAVPVFGPMVIR